MVVLALTLTMAGCFGGLRDKKVRKLREGPPRQLLYSIELTLNGEVISSPRVTVLEGEEASITISGDDLTSDIEIQIEEDGTISAQVVHGGGQSTTTLNSADLTIRAGNGDTLQISATIEPVD
jgi:hypothetical protein